VLVSGGARVRSVAEAVAMPAAPPDPRPVQTTFAVLVLADLAVHWLSGVDLGALPLVGTALAVTLTAVAWLVPWSRVAPWSSAALLSADLLVLGLAQLDPGYGGPIALAALPAYFLGRHFARAGIGVAVLGVAALVVLPAVVASGVDAPQTAHLVVTALVVLAGAQVAALAVATLRREQQVAAAIVDSVPVGVVLVDADGHYRAMSRSEPDLLASVYPGGTTDAGGAVYSADGLTRLALPDYPSARAARGEEFDDVVIWVGDDPTARRALSVTARQVRDERGASCGASLACHDITGFLHASTVKDDFVATVSHELRTPLTSVLGYLEIVLDRDDLAPGVRHQLDVSLRNARRLDGLVGDLLAAADDAGATVLTRGTTDVGGLVEHAVRAVDPGAATRRVHIQTDVPAGLTAYVDAARMRQVLDNLLSNAVKFARPGGQVCVRAYADVPADGPLDAPSTVRPEAYAELVLEVVDDGPGFGPADRDLLFNRFYRSDRARRDAVPGVGLGLSIVRDIVTAHGGRVDARSDAGRGTTFVVRVPCGVAAGLALS
jgi:two-component system phosphate regulon sensor histidine kinase PhoR